MSREPRKELLPLLRSVDIRMVLHDLVLGLTTSISRSPIQVTHSTSLLCMISLGSAHLVGLHSRFQEVGHQLLDVRRLRAAENIKKMEEWKKHLSPWWKDFRAKAMSQIARRSE